MGKCFQFHFSTDKFLLSPNVQIIFLSFVCFVCFVCVFVFLFCGSRAHFARMKLVASFPYTAVNPFDNDPDASSSSPSVADWDNLPPDIKGMILDMVAASSPTDFVNLSSCSKAWRYASLTKTRQAGGKMHQLKNAFSVERSFVQRNRATRERVLKVKSKETGFFDWLGSFFFFFFFFFFFTYCNFLQKAKELKLRDDACYLCFIFFFLLMGSLCVLSGALGFHFLVAAASPISSNSSLYLCGNATSNSTFNSTSNSCCVSPEAAEPLKNCSIGISLFWL